jgi:hypothetical protein
VTVGSVSIDACVLINLCATARLREIAQALGLLFIVVREVADETFYLHLSNPQGTNVSLATNSAQATILNDERLPATVRGAVCTPYGEGCEHFEHYLIDHLRGVWCGHTTADSNPTVAPFTGSDLYLAANIAADSFARTAGGDFSRLNEMEFRSRLAVAERRDAPDWRSLPERARTRYLLTLLLEASDRVDVMQAICAWSFTETAASPLSWSDQDGLRRWPARTRPST